MLTRWLAGLLVFLCGMPLLVLGTGGCGSGVVCVNYWCYSWGPTPQSTRRHAIEAVDVNADGRPDLVTAAGLPEFRVHLGQGGSSFAPPVAIPSALAAVDLLILGDFDGNGSADVLVADSAVARIQVFLGDGAGGFAAGIMPFTLPGMSTLTAVEPASFNGDASTDAVFMDVDGGVLALFAMGAGAMGASPAGRAELASGSLQLAASRLNGDGTTDIVLTETNSRAFAVFTSDATGAFTLSFGPEVLPSAPRSVILGEFNGMPGDDGAVLMADGTVRVYVGDGAGGAMVSSQPAFPTGLEAALRLVGLPDPTDPSAPLDLAAVGIQGGLPTIVDVHNNGDGTFGAPGFPTRILSVDDIEAVDLNGDEHIDVAQVSNEGLGIGIGQQPPPETPWGS